MGCQNRNAEPSECKPQLMGT